jgi:hypothetical protein
MQLKDLLLQVILGEKALPLIQLLDCVRSRDLQRSISPTLPQCILNRTLETLYHLVIVPPYDSPACALAHLMPQVIVSQNPPA